MTEPSQYFKGRTVQEQMNEVIGYVDTRAAEVATDAIASDVAQVHQDMLDADADASAAAASAAAAADTLANAVKKTGESSQNIAGDIAISGDLSVSGTTQLVDVAVSTTIEVPTPVTNADAANKKYVDDADALKLDITDINQYAVGLTGDQTNIAGRKDFVFMPYSKKVTRVATNATQWWKLWKMDASNANNLRMWFKIYSGTLSTYLYATVSNNGQNVTLVTFGPNRYAAANFKISVSGTELILWCKPIFATSRIFGYSVNEVNVNYQPYSYWSVHEDSGQYDEPTTSDYDIVVTATYDGA